jgi:hypothetical protein
MAPAAIFVAVVLVLPFFLAGEGEVGEDRFPIEAAKALDHRNTFHDDVVGGYLIWNEGPARQVFIDDRAELFQEQTQRFVALRNGRQPWEPVFDDYQIEQALLREGEPMILWLEQAGWNRKFEDAEFVVLEKS